MTEAICILKMHVHIKHSESKNIVSYNNSSCFTIIHIKMNLMNNQSGAVGCIYPYVRTLWKY